MPDTSSAVSFWDSVSQMFGNNDHVMYELYNEPHAANEISYNSGMNAMMNAVRKNTNNPMVVAGAYGYAYDS
jgi:aryl-phospho-beta-D-glucosidase BglC (GH1 family)